MKQHKKTIFWLKKNDTPGLIFTTSLVIIKKNHEISGGIDKI